MKKSIFWIIVLFMIAIPLVVATDLNTSLVGFWTFDNSTIFGNQTIGSFGNTQNGTIYQDALSKVPGRFGEGIQVGVKNTINSFVRFPSTVDIITNENFSVSFYMKQVNIAGVGVVISKGHLASTSNTDLMVDNNAPLRFLMYTSPSTGVSVTCGGLTLTNWNHIVIMNNRSLGMTIYANGVNCSFFPTTTVKNYHTSANLPVQIGINETNQQSNFTIDNLGIWNRILNSSEVLQLNNTDGSGIYPFVVSNNLFSFNGTAIPNGTSFAQNFINITQPAYMTNNTINCSLFLDGVLNSSNIYSNLSNETFSFNVTFSNTNLGFSNHSYFISCKSNITNTTYNTSIYSFNLTSNTYVLVYTNITNETNIESFVLNISTIGTVNLSSAILFWNNSVYSPTKNNHTYNYSINIPFVPTNSTKIEFYWNYTLFYNDGSNTTFTTLKNNQTISWKIFYPTLNITVYDQLAKEYVNAFTINASNGTESYVLTATAGNVTLISPMDSHNNKSFTIRAYNYVLNNYTTTYSMTYTTAASLTLTPTIGFNFRLLDEATTNSFNTSKPTSIQMQFFCVNQTQLITVTQANFSYNISCDLNKITTILTYPSASYYRTLPFDLITNYSLVKIWLIDALSTPYILNVFQIYDLLGVYTNPRVLITRIINSTEESITGDFVDATNSISAYLVQNQNYNIKVTSSSLPDRIMGGYTATTSGAQILRLFDLQLAGIPTSLDATTQASTGITNSSGVFRIVTIVNSTTATFSSYAIYNSSGGNIFSSSSSNGNVAYTYTTSTNYSCTEQFITNLTVVTPTGTYQTSKILKGCDYVTNPAQFSNPNTLKFAIALLIVILALALTIQTQQVGGLLIFGLLALLVAWGPQWLVGMGLVSWTIVGLIGVLLIWNAFKN